MRRLNSSADQSSIGRRSFGVRLRLRRISRGLDEGSKGFHADHGIAAADEIGGSAEMSLTRSPVLPASNQTAFSRYLTAEARGLKALLTATPAVPKGGPSNQLAVEPSRSAVAKLLVKRLLCCCRDHGNTFRMLRHSRSVLVSRHID